MSELTIATVGHSNLTIEALLVILRRGTISTVVDVRTSPYSRYTPQFNQGQLQGTLKQWGMRYVFEGQDLGGRPSDPACYKTGVVPAEDANYLRLVDYLKVEQQDWYQRGIDRLIALARLEHVAILCSEGDPHKCHRHHLITPTLLGRGITVHHLRADSAQDEILSPGEGSGPKQQLSLFG